MHGRIGAYMAPAACASSYFSPPEGGLGFVFALALGIKLPKIIKPGSTHGRHRCTTPRLYLDRFLLDSSFPLLFGSSAL